MNVMRGLKSPDARKGIQILLVTCTGAAAIDVLDSAIGNVNQLGLEDVGWLLAVLACLIAGLVIGHVLRGRLPLVELLSAPVAFVCIGLYIAVKLVGITGDARVAIVCVMMGSFTASLSLLDAFPAGQGSENRRGRLIDDGAIFTLVIIASSLASRMFISSPLIENAWLVPGIILGGAGVVDSLVAWNSIRRPGLDQPRPETGRRQPISDMLPSLKHPLLAILRGHMFGLAILVFLVAALEIDWIAVELYGNPFNYADPPNVFVNSCTLLAALGGAITGGASAKACRLARRKSGRVVAAVLLVFVPILIPGGLIAASVLFDWVLAGMVALFLVAGHVAGLIIQFTDSGYKG